MASTLAGSGMVWILLVVGAILVQALALRDRRLALSLVILNTVALHWGLGLSWPALASLAAGLAWIFLGLALTRGLASRRPGAAALIVFLPLFSLWFLARRVPIHPTGGGALLFAGASYALVKAWTFIKDVQDGKARTWDSRIAVAYFLHFPTFQIGPMHLYGEFETALRSPRRLGPGDLVDLTYRLLKGLVKVVFLAPLLKPYSLLAFSSLAEVPPASLPLACIVFSLLLYLDFSGLSDISCALSGLMGIAAPENFRSPFLAADPAEFWRRWHMSLTRVLTSYIFVPLSRILTGRMPAVLTAALATSVAFLLCGVWHGAEPRYLLWGLWHAAGVFAAGRMGPTRSRSPLRKALCVLGTFLFVSAGWIFFAIPLAPPGGGGKP